MKKTVALLAAAVITTTSAFAANEPAKPAEAAKPAAKKPKEKPAQTYVVVDASTELLLSKDAAKASWTENVPAKAAKLYSPKKWGFVTEVSGGFTSGKACVVTARVMMLPLGINGKTMLYKPAKSTSTFDTLATASKEQCSELASKKLSEAIHAMIATLGE